MNYLRTDRNGTKYYENWICPRCSGHGRLEQWKFSGFTCYQCGGSGRREKAQIVKEYTDEYSAKLEARRAKKMEGLKPAEDPAEDLSEVVEDPTEDLSKVAEDPESSWIGSVGEKLVIDVEYKRSFYYVSRYGLAYIHMMADSDGNVVIWKTSGLLKKGDTPVNDMEAVRIQATVKAHSEYNGMKQTEVIRVRVI